ncbi:hypothetical protein ACH4NT_14565 [Streptomyces lydicus]|uniref:hypothetical protein n=1 Tax=Streptomyces lydicus TaxID=47763 RepID=UPI00379A8554
MAFSNGSAGSRSSGGKKTSPPTVRECRVTMPLGSSRWTLTVRVWAACQAIQRSQGPETGSWENVSPVRTQLV